MATFVRRAHLVMPFWPGPLGRSLCQWAFISGVETRVLALTGIVATLAIVFASGSSGPIMTTLSVSVALALWKIRGHLASDPMGGGLCRHRFVFYNEGPALFFACSDRYHWRQHRIFSRAIDRVDNRAF